MHWQRYRWFSPHCHSAVSRVWRSILWRRAWEEQTNQRGEMRRKCDWLAWGGGVGVGKGGGRNEGAKRNMHTQWGIKRWKGLVATATHLPCWNIGVASLIWGLQGFRPLGFRVRLGGELAHVCLCVCVCVCACLSHTRVLAHACKQPTTHWLEMHLWKHCLYQFLPNLFAPDDTNRTQKLHETFRITFCFFLFDVSILSVSKNLAFFFQCHSIISLMIWHTI